MPSSTKVSFPPKVEECGLPSVDLSAVEMATAVHPECNIKGDAVFGIDASENQKPYSNYAIMFQVK